MLERARSLAGRDLSDDYVVLLIRSFDLPIGVGPKDLKRREFHVSPPSLCHPPPLRHSYKSDAGRTISAPSGPAARDTRRKRSRAIVGRRRTRKKKKMKKRIIEKNRVPDEGDDDIHDDPHEDDIIKI